MWRTFTKIVRNPPSNSTRTTTNIVPFSRANWLKDTPTWTDIHGSNWIPSGAKYTTIPCGQHWISSGADRSTRTWFRGWMGWRHIGQTGQPVFGAAIGQAELKAKIEAELVDDFLIPSRGTWSSMSAEEFYYTRPMGIHVHLFNAEADSSVLPNIETAFTRSEHLHQMFTTASKKELFEYIADVYNDNKSPVLK